MIGLPVTQVVSPANAQSGNIVIVNTGAANIRSGPAANTTSIGTVPGGTELAVSGRTANNTWWRVESPFGQGWISDETVAFRGTVASVPVVSIPEGTLEQPTLVVEFSPATVYRNPNHNSFILGIAPTGMTLFVTGRSMDGKWWQVETTLGSGFVHIDDVAFRGSEQNVSYVADPGPTFNGPTVQVNSATNVMATPGGGEVVASLAAGAVLPTGGRTADNTWWQIADTWGTGWIPVANVSLAGSAGNIRATVNTSTPGPAYTGQSFATVIVGVERKVAYKLDSYDSIPFWAAHLGETLGVTARSPNGLWLQVTKHDNAYEAWVNFSGITLEGTLADVPVVDPTPIVENVAIVNTAWLNVRSGPDAKYQRLVAVPGGEALTVTGYHPTRPWLRVARDDFGIGWIKTEYIIFRGNWDALSAVREPVGDVELPVAIVEIPHHVYSQPDWAYPAGVIQPGLYTIVGRTATFTWAQIETPLGDVWISFDEFLLRGIATSAPVMQ